MPKRADGKVYLPCAVCNNDVVIHDKRRYVALSKDRIVCRECERLLGRNIPAAARTKQLKPITGVASLAYQDGRTGHGRPSGPLASGSVRRVLVLDNDDAVEVSE